MNDQVKDDLNEENSYAACGEMGASPIFNLGKSDGSLVDGLEKRRVHATDERHKLSRALRILREHPEFEEFLWLLRSGLV